MNKSDSLKCISYLSDVIGLLSGKWERPHTDIEVAILQQLHDVQETIRKAYEAEQNRSSYLQEWDAMDTFMEDGTKIEGLPIIVVTDHPYFQEQLEQEKRERP